MYFNEYDTNNADYSIKVIKSPPKGRFVQGDSLDFKTVRATYSRYLQAYVQLYNTSLLHPEDAHTVLLIHHGLV